MRSALITSVSTYMTSILPSAGMSASQQALQTITLLLSCPILCWCLAATHQPSRLQARTPSTCACVCARCDDAGWGSSGVQGPGRRTRSSSGAQRHHPQRCRCWPAHALQPAQHGWGGAAGPAPGPQACLPRCDHTCISQDIQQQHLPASSSL